VFVQYLAKTLKVSYDPSAPAPATPGRARDLPLYGGAPLVPPPTYQDLELKGISGSKGRRFALINNQTFAQGESARVRLGAKEVRVRCLEIRSNSVVISLSGEEATREIFLPSGS
jgi:hypothetical protein